MAAYVKGVLTLFVVLTVLLHAAPQESSRKYLHFFAELILTLALLSPVLSLFCDSEEFLELIAYETFWEELTSVADDMEQLDYLYSDYHRESYEKAIAEDVRRIAEGYDFFVQEASVKLSQDYTVEHITLLLSQEALEKIVIAPIGEGEAAETDELQTELMKYYQLDKGQVDIRYDGQG